MENLIAEEARAVFGEWMPEVAIRARDGKFSARIAFDNEQAVLEINPPRYFLLGRSGRIAALRREKSRLQAKRWLLWAESIKLDRKVIRRLKTMYGLA